MPEIQIIISFDPAAGRVSLGTNAQEIMSNPVIVFGLLETAKLQFIQQLEAKESRIRITPATILPPGFPGH